MQMFLNESGNLCNANDLPRQEVMLKDDEMQYSDSDSDSGSDAEAEEEDFEQINRLNEQSAEKLKTLDKKSNVNAEKMATTIWEKYKTKNLVSV